MPGIIGEICSNEKHLKRVASKRRKEYLIESVPNTQVETRQSQGWQIVRKGKTRTKVRKPKATDVFFEDKIWMIFYNLGFSFMNETRHCKLKFDGYTKQIDVLARDEDNVFIVDCQYSASEGIINAKNKLEEYVGKRGDIVKAIQSQWGHDCGKIHLLVVISSQTKRQDDEDYVEEKKDKNIYLWSMRDIKYIESLIGQIGHTAKFQLYSVIFAGRKQRALKKEYLALRSKIGGHLVYSFLIPAKALLNYAYVHHRKLTGIVEASQAYQRMLRSKKINEIRKFIDEEEGCFPNSIIVNFTMRLEWDKKETRDSITVGTITLPGFYGCAWIIDGQHRLYGAASAERDIVVPVLAFEKISQKEQANLFVEINEKQKKVPPELRWDLYSDLYRDSIDDRQKFLYQIAETAKKMEASGPLMGYIDIPSIPKDRPVKLSLTTVCTTIEKYSPWGKLVHPTDENKTPENAARLINTYYEVLKSLWPEDWRRGTDSVLLSNSGFGVFMMIFQDIVKHLDYKGKQELFHPTKTSTFKEILNTKYLKPVIEFLKTDQLMQKALKSQSGRGSQSDNAAYLDLKIREFIPEFAPPRIEELPPVTPAVEPPAISSIETKARDVEGCLRGFILLRLKQHYGSDRWWKHGLPGQVKNDADDSWKAEVSRKPGLRHDKEQNEFKLNLLGLGHMIDIIIYGQNWEQIFADVFMKKGNVQRRIKDIMALRNPSSHARQIDDQDILDGMGGLLWLSNCIGKPELNPYT